MSYLRHRSLTAALAGCCALVAAGPVAGARASDASIKQVLKTDIPRIIEEEGKFATALAEYKKAGNLAPVDAALDSNIKALKSVRAEIAQQSAQSKRVRSAKAKLERSLKRVIGAYQRLKVAFGLKRSDPKGAQKQARKALLAIKQADKELREAAKLLER